MKTPHLPAPRILILLGALLFAASCAYRPPANNHGTEIGSFARVKPVLERNCVHCHGANRLPGMPSLTDTKSLASLIGPGKLIVPGNPGQSRFYQVTTFSDSQAGAMPPTGHAIGRNEAEILRDWIQAGAPLPEEPVKLSPQGTAPRSR